MSDSRLLVVFHGITRQTVEDFLYKSISSVQTRAGIGDGSLTVHASGNDAVITTILKADLKYLGEEPA